VCDVCHGEFVEEIEEDSPPLPSVPAPQPQPAAALPFPQGAPPVFGQRPPSLLNLAQFMRQYFVQFPNVNQVNGVPNVDVTASYTFFPGQPAPTTTDQQQPQAPYVTPPIATPPPMRFHRFYGPNIHPYSHAHFSSTNTNIPNPPMFNLWNSFFPGGVFAGSEVPLAGNPGDYVFGNFDQILNQLFQNANQTGNPPASRSAVDDLKTGQIDESQLEGKPDCAICKEDLALGAEYVEMPCKHIFDKECILQWLGLHNSCPVCRYELKTDNPDYESRRSSGNNNNRGGSRSNNNYNNSNNNRSNTTTAAPTNPTPTTTTSSANPSPSGSSTTTTTTSSSVNGSNNNNNNNNNIP
jgi:hypothetical protein